MGLNVLMGRAEADLPQWAALQFVFPFLSCVDVIPGRMSHFPLWNHVSKVDY